MRKEILCLIQWVLVGFIICNILLFIEVGVPVVLMVLAGLTSYCDLSFLIIQNLMVEVLLFYVLCLKRFADLPNKRSLAVSNVVVWLCFAIWYCQGDRSDGMVSLPLSDALTWLYPMSERMAVYASQYVVWTTILIAAEGIVSLIIEKYFKIGRRLGKAYMIGCLVVAIGLVFFGKEVEGLLYNGPKSAYSEHFDIRVKVIRTDKNTSEVEVSSERLKSNARLSLTGHATILLRHDSIGVYPDGRVTVLQKGDFAIYDANGDRPVDGKGDGKYDDVWIDTDPFEVRIHPHSEPTEWIEPDSVEYYNNHNRK